MLAKFLIFFCCCVSHAFAGNEAVFFPSKEDKLRHAALMKELQQKLKLTSSSTQGEDSDPKGILFNAFFI